MVLIIDEEGEGTVFASSTSSERVTLRYDPERRVVIASGWFESLEVSLDDLLGEDA